MQTCQPRPPRHPVPHLELLISEAVEQRAQGREVVRREPLRRRRHELAHKDERVGRARRLCRRRVSNALSDAGARRAKGRGVAGEGQAGHGCCKRARGCRAGRRGRRRRRRLCNRGWGSLRRRCLGGRRCDNRSAEPKRIHSEQEVRGFLLLLDPSFSGDGIRGALVVILGSGRRSLLRLLLLLGGLQERKGTMRAREKPETLAPYGRSSEWRVTVNIARHSYRWLIPRGPRRSRPQVAIGFRVRGRPAGGHGTPRRSPRTCFALKMTGAAGPVVVGSGASSSSVLSTSSSQLAGGSATLHEESARGRGVAGRQGFKQQPPQHAPWGRLDLKVLVIPRHSSPRIRKDAAASRGSPTPREKPVEAATRSQAVMKSWEENGARAAAGTARGRRRHAAAAEESESSKTVGGFCFLSARARE